MKKYYHETIKGNKDNKTLCYIDSRGQAWYYIEPSDRDILGAIIAHRSNKIFKKESASELNGLIQTAIKELDLKIEITSTNPTFENQGEP